MGKGAISVSSFILNVKAGIKFRIEDIEVKTEESVESNCYGCENPCSTTTNDAIANHLADLESLQLTGCKFVSWI